MMNGMFEEHRSKRMEQVPNWKFLSQWMTVHSQFVRQRPSLKMEASVQLGVKWKI